MPTPARRKWAVMTGLFNKWVAAPNQTMLPWRRCIDRRLGGLPEPVTGAETRLHSQGCCPVSSRAAARWPFAFEQSAAQAKFGRNVGRHMRKPIFLFALLFAAPAALALKIDAKALARFDVNHALCEARVAEMRGQGDEIYLSLWNVKLDSAAHAQLAQARKTAPYAAERRRLVPVAPRAGEAAAFEQECRGMWGQAQRSMKDKS